MDAIFGNFRKNATKYVADVFFVDTEIDSVNVPWLTALWYTDCYHSGVAL